MAEAVIGSIAGEIVASLVPQALEKVGKLWGVKCEIKALQETVSEIEDELNDAEEKYDHDQRVRRWFEKLKDAFYEVQDVLEEFNIEAKRRELRGHNEMMKEVRTFFSSSNQLAFNWKMSDKVRAVREKIRAIIKVDREFQLVSRPLRSEVEQRRRRETHSFIREEDIIGRDDDKEAVMKFLLNSDVEENVSILPIVGIGGLEKTALAQLVYNDKMVGKQFDLKMWVCVSDEFNVKKIVKNIIARARERPTEDEMEELQRKLRAEIDGKKYLSVLDDLWEEDQEKWWDLKNLLMEGAKGSRILITTRLPSVAKITCTTPFYFLKGLPESLSLELLMHMAGRNIKEIQDSDMLAIGKEIVKKCSGVPLVIRTIGSLLYFKETEQEWSQFKDCKLQDVCQEEDGIISVLKLSYEHLPSHLKQCFAFCSLFPRDYQIKKQTLVDLWMAQGFIQSSDGRQPLEDIAHGYFTDLLWRNFLQDFQKDPWKGESCKMHDLMHDLACSIAGNKYWRAWDRPKSIHERTRHISYYGSTSMSELPISHLKAKAVKTLFSIEQNWAIASTVSETDLRQLIQRFKGLHILDLHTRQFAEVPRSICKLKHLTYLNFSNNGELKKLSNSVTRLQNLQTLNLYNCSFLEELPRDIRKLVSLRNLNIDACEELSYVPRGLGQLSSLHRLTRFILPKKKALAKNYSRLGELNGLKNIRGSLCIGNLGSVTNVVAESKAANLIGKPFLESLTLCWGDFDDDDVAIRDKDEALLDELRPYADLQELEINGYKGESFPEWMTSLHKLVELRLSQCPKCNHLPPLGRLPHLKSLDIWGLTELEYIESDHSISLPSLLKLEIHNCEKLREMPRAPHLEELMLWKANITVINGLNKLKRLTMRMMESLECLPEEGLKTLNSLDSLDISRCPRLNSLSLGMRHLSTLRSLSIIRCEELDLCKDESGNILDFQGLERLRYVSIRMLPKLASLPQWLMHASNLEHLDIYECSNLKSIPEQIGALQSLQRLEIRFCPSLTSLPEGMRRLASLAHLTIQYCPDLEKRCERDAGEDWHKISHVPDIELW